MWEEGLLGRIGDDVVRSQVGAMQIVLVVEVDVGWLE